MASNGKGNGTPGAKSSPPKEPNGKPGANGTSSSTSSAGRSSLKGSELPHDEAPAGAAAEPSAPAPAAAPVGSHAHAGSTPADDSEAKPAAWGEPLARFEKRWTGLESRLLTFVLIAQILSLVAWVLLNGLSESVTTTAGGVFRAAILASGAGTAAWFATRARPEAARRNLVLFAMALGFVIVLGWRAAASSGGAAASLDKGVVGYFDNVKGWLQEGSTLTLLGGLRGLGTRLTLWLALLGGSLATASGKHIHVDVVFRFLPKPARLPVAVFNYLTASAVCFAAVWGFFDHIAIESYGSKASDSASAKIENAVHHIGIHAFFTRKQLGLDLRSLPHVLAGQRYDQWMTADAWNAWVSDAGFEDHFDAAKVQSLKVTEGTHPAFIVSPDGEATRSCLAHTLGLVFPFGLAAIALRFLLRALLTLSGHYSPDPDEAHREEIGQSSLGNPEGGVPKPLRDGSGRAEGSA